MEAAMNMMRQAAALRVAWYASSSFDSAASHSLLNGWINLERYASRAMMEAMRPIGVTW
jgi:hypothetical protein